MEAKREQYISSLQERSNNGLIKIVTGVRRCGKSYLQYMQDAFLIEKAQRYDVRGKHYIGTPMKYYFVDVGLRNARLNFRQNDYGHIMENVVYNELRMRGMLVDVGVVKVNCKEYGKSKRKQLEVDFVCNRGSQRYYIQSAYVLYDEEKRKKEIQSLRHINDSFKKILVQKRLHSPTL